MLDGLHHVALLTSDIERFIDFYTSIFEAKVIDDLKDDGIRHALIDVGGGAALHPFQLPDGTVGQAGGEMFQRGHLDHIALNVPDADTFQLLRSRLVEAGASDGTVTDFGMVKTCFFRDPDGMDAEIALWCDGPPRSFAERILEPYEA